MTLPPCPPVAPDHWMEQAYWLSQVAGATFQFILIAAAIAAGVIAYRQFSAFRLFELLKYTQGDVFRHARRAVIREIGPIKDTEWWKDERLEALASDCCAHYDILGRMLMFKGNGGVSGFFIENWADSIVRTYEILSQFIEQRRAKGGNDSKGYEWLYQRAREIRPTIGPTWPPPN